VGLRLEKRWLWDFWFATDGDDVHVFYLQAPRSLGDPELRHRNATIGHAVSRDLRRWCVLADALAPGVCGEFDDLATWTGSILRHDGRWHLFYTGLSHADDGAIQRIGHAVSEDLRRWERRSLVLEADPRWYAREHWRDPWVEWDEHSGHFEMLVTASANAGPADSRGVIGHAHSEDMRSWQIGPPLSRPGELAQLEVPQRVHLGGDWRILFSATAGDHGAERLARAGTVAQWGTHYLTAPSRHGPYELGDGCFLTGDGSLYGGRLLRHQGAWHFFAWRLHDERGDFRGELSDPIPLAVGADGSLSLTRG
jgi:beta-fructofuranosidase